MIVKLINQKLMFIFTATRAKSAMFLWLKLIWMIGKKAEDLPLISSRIMFWPS